MIKNVAKSLSKELKQRMYEVKKERTGWRDLKLSHRHRLWGWDCPAIDLDFLFLEYDKGKPVAIVEYKHENAPPQDAKHPTYQAIINLGNDAGRPVFCTRYSDDFKTWKVIPLNPKAKEFLPNRTVMSEKEWITFLYKIRGYDVPASLFDENGILI